MFVGGERTRRSARPGHRDRHRPCQRRRSGDRDHGVQHGQAARAAVASARVLVRHHVPEVERDARRGCRSSTSRAGRWSAGFRTTGRRSSRRSSTTPHLFFESNFNGGWEEYIDAFSHILTRGMKVFWGTSYGFPQPLPTGPFKAYIKRQRVRRQSLLRRVSRRHHDDGPVRARARPKARGVQGARGEHERRGVRRSSGRSSSPRCRTACEQQLGPGHRVHGAHADPAGRGDGAARVPRARCARTSSPLARLTRYPLRPLGDPGRLGQRSLAAARGSSPAPVPDLHEQLRRPARSLPRRAVREAGGRGEGDLGPVRRLPCPTRRVRS